MAKYAYPAIFTPEVEGGIFRGYSVRFPDLEGCFTQGDTLAEALLNAQEALALMLVDWRGSVPYPSTSFIGILPQEGVHWIACDIDTFVV